MKDDPQEYLDQIDPTGGTAMVGAPVPPSNSTSSQIVPAVNRDEAPEATTQPVATTSTTPIPSSQFTRKDWIKDIIMPLVILALGAISVHTIGGRLQEQSFNRSELFKARLQRILAAQDQARQIRTDAEEAFRLLRSNEDYASAQIKETPLEARDELKRNYHAQVIASPALQTLRRSKIDADIIVEDIGGGKESPIGKIVSQYGDNLTAFRNCINTNTGFERSCADEYPDLITYLQQLVVALGRRADAFIASRGHSP